MSIESEAYERHKNLKLAAKEIGMQWQTLYSRLRAQGVPVTGDKLRYGSDTDKLAAKAEAEFHKLVPVAINANESKFQARVDFSVNGHLVDVKSSRPRLADSRGKAMRWSFCLKKQSYECDFMCCFCLDGNGDTERILLIPREFFDGMQLLSVACSGRSSWFDYAVEPGELAAFFDQLPKKDA